MTEPARNKNLKKLVWSAIFIGLGSVLSVFPKIPWINGGSITLCSMLPVILISYRFGLKWGFGSSLAYAALQIVLEPAFPPASNIVSFILCFFLDYIIAFGVLGFGGLFRKTVKHAGIALVAGSALSLSLRFLSHFLSGAIIWAGYAEGNPWVYSLIYNGGYMLPELIMNCIAAAAVGLILGDMLKKETDLEAVPE
ncbi:MAG: energy-coupled thiamine transporter ThiT [Oscillospiraceae bacterium]|jgi:thiamine transporter|nr:energy-coupled thiamine transporter ThiT [Oscillospiraceae bacterium]